MPELPDIVVYIEHLEAGVLGRVLEGIRVASPFLVRSVRPAPREAEDERVNEILRLGKRIVVGFENEIYFILHLMIAGRLRWRERGHAIPRKLGLAALDFPHGTLLITEAGSRKRASLHVVRGKDALAEHDPGGIEVLDATLAAFRERLLAENHTLKRALTDPRLFSGIGNAYSDEILHRARLSPLALTHRLTEDETARLHEAVQGTLTTWIDRLRQETDGKFPEKVTAFRAGMAVHGRYREPCPVCGTAIQRIVFASNETNYCPRCQTGDRLLADRGLSRLLRDDWPRTIDELEALRASRKLDDRKP